MTGQMTDRRNREVVFLSHCILNQSTRYPGGAGRSCCVHEIVEACIERGIGMIQLPCPEELVWGGVTKRWMIRAFGADRAWWYPLHPLLLPIAAAITRFRYRRLARKIARQIADYRHSNFALVGLIGIDGSPSCGVATTHDLPGALSAVAGLELQSHTPEEVNRALLSTSVQGEGLFIQALRNELQKQRTHLRFIGHNLAEELQGKSSTVLQYLDVTHGERDHRLQ
jgi:predicted secreted protein